MILGENIFEKLVEKETVFVDRDIISPHFVPKELPFRESQISKIGAILAVSLQGKKPNNIFVYGKVGTGKTATVRHVMEQLKEYSEKKGREQNYCYINCRVHNSKYRALLKCCKEFYPKENFIGYSAAFIYEKLLEHAKRNRFQLVLVLDEVDKVKDIDELIYALTRGNDEISGEGSVSIIGISNNIFFKERLDARTKSTLCEKEMVFSPYNAEELREILAQRALRAFRPGTVKESAINLASAYSAQVSGDARTAVLLLLRAGELADQEKTRSVTDSEVRKAKEKVEEEVIYSMINTLPEQQQLVLLTISTLTLKQRSQPKITGEEEKGVLLSGEIFESYQTFAKKLKNDSISARWYRQYINELETYGLITTTKSGPGMVGNTRLIKLAFDAEKIRASIQKQFE